MECIENKPAWELDDEGLLRVNCNEGCTALEGHAPWYSKRAGIKKLVVSDAVTKIGRYAFYNCSALEEVQLSDSVVEIGDGAFARCAALRHISLPGNLTEIPVGCFTRCTGLKSVDIPAYRTLWVRCLVETEQITAL